MINVSFYLAKKGKLVRILGNHCYKKKKEYANRAK